MKKLLTLTLSLLMAFSLCLTISAEEGKGATGEIIASANGTPYGTLQEAVNAEGVSEVELQSDTTESITICSGKNITIKLNGKTLTAYDKDAIYVENGATLNIIGQGGKVIATKGGYASVFNNGTTTLTDGGEYLRDGTSKWYIIVNHGTMTIEGPKIESTNQSDTSSAIENGYVNYTSSNSREGYVENTNLANPTLTINNANVSTYGCNAVKNDDGGVLTIHGGEFKTINNHHKKRWRFDFSNAFVLASVQYYGKIPLAFCCIIFSTAGYINANIFRDTPTGIRKCC